MKTQGIVMTIALLLFATDAFAQDGDLPRLDPLIVADYGLLQFGLFQVADEGSCFPISDTINGVAFKTHGSKWQRRANADSSWTDIPSTNTEGEVCSYLPSEPGEYRIVADLSVDSARRRYTAINLLSVSEVGEVTVIWDRDNSPSDAVNASNEDEYPPHEGIGVEEDGVIIFFKTSERTTRNDSCTYLYPFYHPKQPQGRFYNSKWQRRDNAQSPWTEIPGTEEEEQVCSYTPSEPGEYRLIGEYSMPKIGDPSGGGERIKFSSGNILTVSQEGERGVKPADQEDSSPAEDP